MPLLAGAAEVVITPPVGTLLDGYGGRVGGAVGVHDDLHARALVLGDGGIRAAIVSCDLVGVDRRLVARVRELAAAATDIPAEHIMITATHTHAGPAGLRADMDAPLTESTARLIAGSIIEARHEMRPAVLKAGRGSVDSVSQNRRDPDGSIDEALRVLLIDTLEPDGKPIAAVINFACHATVLYRTNMHISADYPGYAMALVRDVLGGAPVLFLNGAAGDVNPAWIEQDYAEAERVGSIVGAEAARRLLELRPLGRRHKSWNIRWDELTDKAVTSGDLVTPRIRIASRTVQVPLRQMEAAGTYNARIAEQDRALAAVPLGDLAGRRRIIEQLTQLRGERDVAERIRPGGPHYLRPEIQAIGLGDGCAILGLPGEFFVETALLIQGAAGIRHLLVACYANHHVFYVVPKHEFARGGYEPGVAVLDETAEETFRETAIGLLREVTNDN